MNIYKKIMRENRILIIGLLLLLSTHIVIMLVNSFAPFGDNVYLRGDNIAQLSGYSAELKRKIANHDGLFYTWGVTGGGSFYYIFSYVLCSVFMLPLILCDIESFTSVLDLSFVVISLLMYLTMSIYLINKPTECKISKESPYLLIFSVSYALLPALVNAGAFYPFLGCFVVMPLVLLGLEKYVANGEWILYFVSLAIVIITNFYIGIMCCFFIVLYYFTLSFQGLNLFFKCSVRILLISTCAVGVAGVIIVPVILSTTSGGYGVSEYYGPHVFTNWFYLVKQSMWGIPPVLVGSTSTAYWECNTYTGVFLTVLCLLYCIESKIDRNIRIRKLAVLLILFLTLNESTANYIIHIFHYTVGIPNRQTILIMLYIIIMSEEAAYYFLNSKMTSKRFIKLSLVSSIILVSFLLSFVKYHTENGVLLSFVISLILIIAYYIVLVFIQKIKKRKIVVILVVMLALIEVFSDYAMLYRNVSSKDDINKSQLDSVIEMSKEIDDDGFYNVAYNGQDISVNLGMLCGYNTLQGYSTIIRYDYIHALDQLGIRVNANIREQGFNSFLNSVFNRKYIIEPKGDVYKYTVKDEIFKDYGKVADCNNMDLYENNDVLSPIVVADGDFKDYEKYLKNYSISNKDVAIANNMLCEELSGVTGLMATVSADSVRIEDTDNCNAMIYEDYLVFSPESEEGTYDHSKDSSAIVSFVAPVTGEYIVDTTSNCHAGYHEKGDVVYAKAQISPTDYNRETGVYATDIKVNVLNYDKCKEAYGIMKKNCMRVSEFSSDRIEGTIVADKHSKVYTSIPYDSSWSVYVDGENLPISSIGDAFLSFEVDQGEHNIVLKYRPKGLLIGGTISTISILIFVSMLLVRGKAA